LKLRRDIVAVDGVASATLISFDPVSQRVHNAILPTIAAGGVAPPSRDKPVIDLIATAPQEAALPQAGAPSPTASTTS
jgi:hypothetical protein